MNILVKRVFIIFASLCLSACQSQQTRAYLLTHPDELKKEIERCHEPGIQTDAHAAHCAMVMSAADKFIKLLDDQQRHPEEFGMRVMDAQVVCAAKKAALDNAQQRLGDLLARQALPEEVNEATNAVKKANMDYVESQRDVQVLQAVIGVNSPE